MADFFSFRRMITPRLIQFLFVVGMVLSIIAGFIIIAAGLVGFLDNDDVASGLVGVLGGFALIIFGPIVIRVYCEFLIVFFRINETLTDVDQKMECVITTVDQRGAEIAGSSQAHY